MTRKKPWPRILCVDDEPEICETLKEVLKALPSRVEVAKSGQEAMEMVFRASDSSDPFKLFVLDMRVPHAKGEEDDPLFGRNALEVFKWLAGTLPAIIFTAYPSYQNCVECIRFGAFDYIPKVDPETQTGNVRELFNRCKEVLYGEQSPLSPLQRLLDEHMRKLVTHYGGKYVGVLEKEKAQRVGYTRNCLGEFALVVGDTAEEVKEQLLRRSLLPFGKPPIIKVPTEKE